MQQRRVNSLLSGFNTQDDTGMRLIRVLGEHSAEAFDPFLQLNVLNSSSHSEFVSNFPVHPQRGIETFTYLVRGEIEHQNSLGHNSVIKDGGCQWMTSGRGILHQEKIKLHKDILAFQLWINLPAGKKMVAPKYVSVSSQMVPEVKEAGATIRVVAGVYKGIDGAMRGEYVDMQFIDLKMDANSSWQMQVNPEDTVFAYILDGQAAFSEDFQPNHQAILLGDGELLKVASGAQGAHFVLAVGKPLRESIAWGGAIVMNNHEQVKRAFAQLKFGLFLDNDLA